MRAPSISIAMTAAPQMNTVISSAEGGRRFKASTHKCIIAVRLYLPSVEQKASALAGHPDAHQARGPAKAAEVAHAHGEDKRIVLAEVGKRAEWDVVRACEG